MKCQFNNATLSTIIEQALVYQCACPAQVAELLLEMRRVKQYEDSCLENQNDHLAVTHQKISEAVTEAHIILERCLDEVLDHEGWDRSTFKMPAYLRPKSEGN